MNRIQRGLVGVALIFVAIFNLAQAASNLEKQKQALNLINEFAQKLCYEVSVDTSSQKLGLSGRANAELNGFLKKFADIGIEGEANYEKSNSQGLLQKDLAEALKNSTDCRLEVFNKLSTQLLGGISSETPEVKTVGFNLSLQKLLVYETLCHVDDNTSLVRVVGGYQHHGIISGKYIEGQSISIDKNFNFDASMKFALVITHCADPNLLRIVELTVTGEDHGKGARIKRFPASGDSAQYAIVYEVN